MPGPDLSVEDKANDNRRRRKRSNAFPKLIFESQIQIINKIKQ